MKKLGNSTAGLCKALIIPIALYLFFLVLIPERIGNWNSIHTMLVLAVVPTITAYGVSFSFVSGIMDFSVGSRLILSGMCAAIAGHYFGFWGMLVAAIVSSLILSIIVGSLFAVLKIPSLVVSLGTLMLFEIAGVELSRYVETVAPNVSAGSYIKAPDSLTFLGTSPWNFLILLLVAVLFRVCNYRTKFASQAQMVGSDELISRNIGINPMKVKFITYVVGSIFLGIAAVVSACYSSAVGYKMDSGSLSMVFKPMMAVIIGLSLQNFVKLDIGIFLGSLCISTIFTGIIALGWSDSLQNVILGLFMLLVLAFPVIRQKYAVSKRRAEVRKEFAQKGVHY